jgi:type IV pilus assembly protein PilA
MRQRTSTDQGFTLVELLVVVVIIGVLLAIAVPSYLKFKDRAHVAVAESNLRAALPAVEAFYADHLTYIGLDDPSTGMRSIDQGIAAGVTVNDPADLSDTHYCLKSVADAATYWDRGPGGTITDVKPAGCT